MARNHASLNNCFTQSQQRDGRSSHASPDTATSGVHRDAFEKQLRAANVFVELAFSYMIYDLTPQSVGAREYSTGSSIAG